MSDVRHLVEIARASTGLGPKARDAILFDVKVTVFVSDARTLTYTVAYTEDLFRPYYVTEDANIDNHFAFGTAEEVTRFFRDLRKGRVKLVGGNLIFGPFNET